MVMPPLRFSDPDCYEKSAGFIARQAARPESWRDQWPDDPDLIKARDVISRILQHEYGFLTNAFLPDDELDAIWALGDEFNDPLLTIVEVEFAFGIKIDEMESKIYYGTTMSYLDFVKLVLDLAGPDYERKIVDGLLLPLCLPDDYHQAGRSDFRRKFPLLGRDAGRHRELRRSQSRRPTDWTDRWPDEPDLIALRDKVSRLLMDRLDWPRPAFVPDDQLAALFHCKRGREYVPAVLGGLNREFGLDLDVDYIIHGGRTYLDLLRRIQAGPGEAAAAPAPGG